MDETDVRYVLEELFAAWPRVSAPSPRVRKAWGPALAEYGVLEAQVAIERLAATAQYLPSLAEFVATIRAVRADAGMRPKAGPMTEYGHNIGLRAPCDDVLDDLQVAEAVKMRGKMVGKR